MSKPRICIDCGREFDIANKRLARCGECHAAHRAAAFHAAIDALNAARRRQSQEGAK